MNKMFYKCSSLSSIDLSKFNASNVETMEQMFYHCSNLTNLDISLFTCSDTDIDIISDLPSIGTLTVNQNFLSKIEKQIPSNWIINIKE